MKIKCPYCKHEYTIEDEILDDYYIFQNTKIHICRECGNEFVNGKTKDIEYIYSNKCKRKDGKGD